MPFTNPRDGTTHPIEDMSIVRFRATERLMDTGQTISPNGGYTTR